ncbi:MAG: 30S ribosomal protein S12 methylthiotransferase RimO [Deltaproteobacteria bacterium]|nr:30S ribosomal protein S12 methylthiotransferase RimO [Deltaproteobacteria bacterium]MBW2117299.1 30S ribosomal protein S12 methylthiotransferase RimO [Deltaproteobacteria bacterium]MBW2342634.1 30S ribosomal protein S12 methylthiotransferase RimO [Deltaproteobacteria bacterium]
MSTKESVFLISLGCSKNLVDSEHMLGLIKSKGFDLASSIEDAGIAVINTCGFIRPAVEEAIDTILEVADLKKQGKLKKIVVAGCFVQRYGYKLLREMPEVDAWLGTGEIYRIADIIENENSGARGRFFIGRPTYLADHSVPRVQTTPFYSAYLRIAEGCNHRCSYCIIPNLRGPLRSRDMESLITESEEMAGLGVKEINLIAQDITMYGNDLEAGVCLEELLKRLANIEGVEWMRLLYCHPKGISDRLLELIESNKAVCPYVDLPLQHVNNEILRAMERDPGNETPGELIDRIRSVGCKISLRTSLMVGFPGETEAMFEELYNFVEETRFDHLGVFIFSGEEGAAAARIRPTVDPEVARMRLDKIMTLQAEIAKEINQQMVGLIQPVLIEGVSPETDLLLTGRTATMAPDVDGQVLINKGEGVAGEIMPVLINEAHAYDLIGEIV